MSTSEPNLLQHASSAYLRSAAHQPTRWHEWGTEAFALAKSEGKPVLLDIGAVWCHWCHVMDRESYESPEVAAFLNEHFVAVKVDRDERPDVDARYQMAVAALAGQGGWPLTVFLTPDGKPFYGGTYFPPEDAYGRPSFRRILHAISEAYRERRAEVEEESLKLMHVLDHGEGSDGHGGEFSPRIVEQMVQSALGSFDRVNGGFSQAPKFPHPPAMELLLDWYARTGEEQVRVVAVTTLEKMARGGVYDQLAGGFHRYSVDERWCVPHFEKMAYDNSELLKNYAHAYQVTRNPFFAEVARDVLRWLREVLSDRERGEMHHDPRRNVLWVARTVEELAAAHSMSAEQVRAALATIKRKMYAARLLRTAPFLDRTLYTGWNALLISATLQAARALHEPQDVAFALRSLDRLLAEVFDDNDGLRHVIAYAEAGKAERPAGMLDDYAYTILALLDAYEAGGTLGYFTRAEKLAGQMIERFGDREGGGFFDAEPQTDAIGALAARRKPFQDSPTPAGDPSAAIALLRLHALNGDGHLRDVATKTLELFAGVAEQFGIHAATYGVAAVWLGRPHIQVVVVGSGAEADALEAAALARFAINLTVLRVRDGRRIGEALPPALAETIAQLPGAATGKAVAILCSGFTCQPPTTDAAELAARLDEAIQLPA